MRNRKKSVLILSGLVLVLGVHAAFGQETRPQTSSADGSPRSATIAGRQLSVGSKQEKQIIAACSAAVDELKAGRVLIDALEAENAVLKERLETEKRTAALLGELNETRKSEGEALRSADAAKNETIAAKDVVITSQEKLIATLKAKKSSPWRRLGDVLIGAAVFAVLK